MSDTVERITYSSARMIEAMEDYLNLRVIKESITVIGIRYANGEFEISFSRDEEDET